MVPGRIANLPTGMPGMIVHAEHRVAGKALEQLVLEHRQRAAEPFLGRLEDEVHRAVEVARLGEIARRAEQHGGVAVMAAGVHHARPGRLVGHVVRLEDRQRVHVGAQPDRHRAVAFAQHADHAGAADAAMHLDAELLELFATMSEVRCSSKPSSGWAWMSWRCAVSSAW